MATKKVAAKVETPKVETPKVETPKADGAPEQVTNPQAQLSAIAQEIMCGKSDVLAVKAVFTVLTVIDGKVVEVAMGSLQSTVRENKTGSRGVHLNGKLNDPTALGVANGVKFQIGANVTACHSKGW